MKPTEPNLVVINRSQLNKLQAENATLREMVLAQRNKIEELKQERRQ